MLRALVPFVQKITEGHSLTAEEAERAFVLLEGEDQDCFFYFTLLAALHTKGETSEELLGFCNANRHFVPPFDSFKADLDRTIDLSGTGGDRVKTPNVSTAASFVVASRNIPVVKQAFLAVTGLTGGANVMQAVGVDPLGLSRQGRNKILDAFGQAGMLVYHANSMSDPAIRKGYFAFWMKRVPETGISFVTAYHLAANVYSPIPMKRRVYGVFDGKYLRPIAQLFQKLGYQKALIIHGEPGIDELTVVGKTQILEVTSTQITERTILPSDVGLSTASVEEITGTSNQGNINDFLRVIYGKERGPKRDMVLLNAAAGFYAVDEVEDLRQGVLLAASQIDAGEVGKKLEDYVRVCGEAGTLMQAKEAAGL